MTLGLKARVNNSPCVAGQAEATSRSASPRTRGDPEGRQGQTKWQGKLAKPVQARERTPSEGLAETKQSS